MHYQSNIDDVPSSASTPTAAKGYAFVKSDALVLGSDEIMLPKAHGTTDMPVQGNLRFGVSI